jgi:hypothetical protein
MKPAAGVQLRSRDIFVASAFALRATADKSWL